LQSLQDRSSYIIDGDEESWRVDVDKTPHPDIDFKDEGGTVPAAMDRTKLYIATRGALRNYKPN
jgi:hypothetical protein